MTLVHSKAPSLCVYATISCALQSPRVSVRHTLTLCTQIPEPLYAPPQRAQIKQLAAWLRDSHYGYTDAQPVAQRPRKRWHCRLLVPYCR